jgi:uncharacterized membrane protein YfcA
MEYLLISIIALFISMVSLFSGFGFGTVLLPVFALFFPLTLAIALSALLHFMNSLSQVILVGKYGNFKIVLKFGIPAAFAALFGAYLLRIISHYEPIFSYSYKGFTLNITWMRLIVGIIIIFSALLILMPKMAKFSFPPRYIPLGGIFSGFLGGFTGYQGALRSAFLIKAGLKKEEFIGTSSWCSIIVDVFRIVGYIPIIYGERIMNSRNLIGLGIASLIAFFGTFLGSKNLHRVTLHGLKILIGAMLLILGVIIISGIKLD